MLARAVLVPVLCVLAAACGSRGERAIELEGATMGTTYRITIVDAPAGIDLPALAQTVDARLAAINDRMSTYLSDSELTRFNASESTDWFAVSPELVDVVIAATGVSEVSGGAFDVTVGPAVNLWGFGPDGGGATLPDAASVERARARVGHDALEARLTPPALKKDRPDVYVDLSAIAKGHAVDRLCDLLASAGVDNYLVEIGGELRTLGHNASDRDWTIAIEQPRAGVREVQQVIAISGLAVATSGDYRNFFEVDGRRYSHTIDPRTARPVTHGLASVTVVHESTAMADALATALLVLGPDAGAALASRLELAALFVVQDGDGLTASHTPAFERLIYNP